MSWCIQKLAPAAAAILCALSLQAAADAAQAQPPAAKPGPAAVSLPAPDGGRVTRTFDFEEPNNPYPEPAGWRPDWHRPPAQPRAGFPEFNNRIGFDFTVAASGRASVRLNTRGGSTCLRLQPGELPVFPNADYAVRVLVRTEGLVHARARVAACLLDQEGREIEGTWARSEPANPGPRWQELDIDVAGDRGGGQAAFIRIELLLVQPRQYRAPSLLGEHELWPEDYSGSAWFDDLTVHQVPRIELRTTSPANTAVGSEKPVLSAVVRDLGGRRLDGRVTIRDITGRTVATHLLGLNLAGQAVLWKPDLPAYGWYTAELDVLADQVRVGRTSTSLVWLAPPRRTDEGRAGAAAGAAGRDLARFGLIADRLGADDLGALGDVVSRVRSGFLFIPAWSRSTQLAGLKAEVASRSAGVERLLSLNQSLTFSLGALPAELSRALLIENAAALDLTTIDERSWMPYLEPTLDVFGQRVVRYQLGCTGDDDMCALDGPGIAGAVGSFERTLSRLVPDPTISVPWPADRAPDAALVGPAPAARAVTISVPASFWPAGFADLAAAWPAEPGVELTVALQSPESSRFGAHAGAIELARRMVEFWAAFGDRDNPSSRVRLAIDAPLDMRSGAAAGAGTVSPGPLLAVWDTMTNQLAGRRIVGRFPAPPGVVCYILGGREGGGGAGAPLEDGSLVLWNEWCDPAAARVDVRSLAVGAKLVDICGNATPVAGDSIPAGDSPVFVEGIDPSLALFVAGLHLEPSFVRAVVTEHEHELVVTNPWPIQITGQWQLKEDEPSVEGGVGGHVASGTGWTITPGGVVDFACGPGETIRIPITLAFGPGQLAGRKDLVLVTRVVADRAYAPMRIRVPLEIGLPDLEMSVDLILRDAPAGPDAAGDAVVMATVTNTGRHSRTLRLEANTREYPAQQLQISSLAPGQTVNKRFVFKGGARALSGRRILVSLSDTEEAQRLNKAVSVP